MKPNRVNQKIPKVKVGDVACTLFPVRGNNHSIIPAHKRCIVEQVVLVGQHYRYLLAWKCVNSVWVEDADIEPGGK